LEAGISKILLLSFDLLFKLFLLDPQLFLFNMALFDFEFIVLDLFIELLNDLLG